MAKAVKYPDPYTPEDIEVLRVWSAYKWGQKFLPDAALPSFIELHEKYKNEGKKKKYVSWDRAFQNFIRWTSPSGQYHNARQWEKWLQAAKRLEFGPRTRPPERYDPRGPQPTKPQERSLSEVGVQALRKLRQMTN